MSSLSAAADRIVEMAGKIVLSLTLAFLLGPAIMVVLLSFSGESFIAFPPRSWGLRQYETLFASDYWLNAVGLSIRVAVPAAIVAVAVGLPAALAAHRTLMPGRGLVQVLGMASLIIPISAFAVALFGVFADLGLLGTFLGIVMAHAILAVPLVLIVVTTALTRIPRELELVAMTLGASRARAWRDVTIRLLLPATVAAFIFAFITSFDEAVLINFLGGPGLVTVPKAIFDSVRFGVDAVITAIATLMFVLTAIVALISLRLGSR
jgi:putative spermidine/putrescine transport system permease protein